MQRPRRLSDTRRSCATCRARLACELHRLLVADALRGVECCPTVRYRHIRHREWIDDEAAFRQRHPIADSDSLIDWLNPPAPHKRPPRYRRRRRHRRQLQVRHRGEGGQTAEKHASTESHSSIALANFSSISVKSAAVDNLTGDTLNAVSGRFGSPSSLSGLTRLCCFQKASASTKLEKRFAHSTFSLRDTLPSPSKASTSASTSHAPKALPPATPWTYSATSSLNVRALPHRMGPALSHSSYTPVPPAPPAAPAPQPPQARSSPNHPADAPTPPSPPSSPPPLRAALPQADGPATQAAC